MQYLDTLCLKGCPLQAWPEDVQIPREGVWGASGGPISPSVQQWPLLQLAHLTPGCTFLHPHPVSCIAILYQVIIITLLLSWSLHTYISTCK